MNVGAVRVVALAAMISVWAAPPPGRWHAPGYNSRVREWFEGGCGGWGDGLGCGDHWQFNDPDPITQLRAPGEGEDLLEGGGEWAELGREPVLPLAAEGDSHCSSESESTQEGRNRVKGERRDRASHIRLCHLNVTHWGDAVEGMLEDPDFDIGLFCEMKLNSEQSYRLSKRLRASGWTCLIHPGVKKSRSEIADELLHAGAGNCSGGTEVHREGPNAWGASPETNG